jgi:geranylgeranyl diphosphate synthase type I
MKNGEISREELAELLQLRGEKVLEKFEEVLFSGIQNPRLLSILEDVNKRGKDTYRPALISLSCEAVGGEPDDTVTVSLMISLAGAGIGIHDDIIDKSETKGFMRTILSLYDADDALLAGDLLIVKGLTAVNEIVRKAYRPQKVADIIQAFQRYYFEICEGVFMEKSWRKNVETELDFCHQVLWKFGSDGEACTRLGALVGDATEVEVEALGNYGRRLCYVCRLADEVKDTLNLEGSLLRRLEYESVPLPLIYAAKSSKENSAKLKAILEGEVTPSDIGPLLDLCFETDAFDYVHKIAQKNMDEAARLLHTLKPSKARTALTLMLEDTFPDSLAQIWDPLA